MLTKQDHERISDAIRAAEARTSGEIVCVLARSSSDYAAWPLALASALALVVPWGLLQATQWPVERILVAQLLTFALVLSLAGVPSIRLRLVPRATQRAEAHRTASEQFVTRGLARKPERTGVLIFVSMAERYVRIVADDGIAALVGQAEWQATVDALTANMRKGEIADGFVEAITACGEVLARHFPREAGSRDVLPDRIYLV